MKISKDEQTKKRFRIFNPIRSICLTLICSFVLCSNSVYATPIVGTFDTDVGQGTYDSIIVNNDGTIDHAATTNFRGIIGNIVSFLQKINRNEYVNGTYLATIYTYFSSVLSDIKTLDTNIYAQLSAMNTLVNTLDWQSSSAFGGLYDEVGGTALSSFTNQSKGTVYARFGPLSSASNLFRLTVPIYGGSNSVRNSYISGITLKTSNMQTDIRQDQYLVFYDNFVDHTDVYLYLYAPISTYFFLKIDLAYNISYNDSYSAAGSYYLGTNSPDYVDFMNYLSNRHSMDLLKDIKDKDFTAEIDGSTIEIDNSINVTPIELDVSIGVQDFTAVNTVSNKLRTWLSTGVGVVDLIAALDQLDDTFFTLHNRSVIETISTGYTDYYD